MRDRSSAPIGDAVSEYSGGEAGSYAIDNSARISRPDDGQSEWSDGMATSDAPFRDPQLALMNESPIGTMVPESADELVDRLHTVLSDDDQATVRRAYDFAAMAHDGQMRQSGSAYIGHPLAVALILADLRLDCSAIVAGLLHDVPEDTGITIQDVEQEFGSEVARLVDGVTKLKRLTAISDGLPEAASSGVDDASDWAENVRKMFLAMAEDIRVVLIKLADRLHNMRTLDVMPPAKQRKTAQETMDIYAPLASRLGIWQIKWELEDLAFRFLEPREYKGIARMLASRRVEREKYISEVIATLEDDLSRVGLRAEVSGRPKHIYSIYRKMQHRGVEFGQIYDLLALRVIVDGVSDCYSALGVVHSLWHPIPGQFDDYIAMPKDSLYQSLHTTVLGPDARPLEIQIRTHDMHRLAEYGVAAHWRYKEGPKRDGRFDQKIAWLRQLLDWQKDVAGGAQEFVESLKTDLFQDQVYVFTPKGAIRELPAGATPLDFAYRIHTDIGHRCIGAKVNRRLVSLDYTLKNGDIVEILTSKAPKGPSRDWLNASLNYVRTAHAREKIRQWFRRQQRDENIIRGREGLEKELGRLGLSQTKVDDVAALFKFEKADDFLAAIGTGEISTQNVAVKLVAQNEPDVRLPTSLPSSPPISSPTGGIQVLGVGDLLTRIARCCKPVPGEAIVGYITRGKGITVHRNDCLNIEAEDERERLVSVEWGRTQLHYPVSVRIDAWDRDGLLRDVASVVAEDKISMSQVSAITNADRTATIRATLEVSGIDTLSRILSKLEGLKSVLSVTRETG
ncbi:MAG TPA: bifunctional (p)ppGpp synthetase/guanosine-3',5'-bis(diphosphate) 3'-pyrophosphohydrolase [Chloroflexota bacterium]|nr:bifunctional (p)ppGpp synthetase/guanosine-3',5'-bis(diphosphate) 3'-pyrophosphohydrolase [Chloroflexota bacterium]